MPRPSSLITKFVSLLPKYNERPVSFNHLLKQFPKKRDAARAVFAFLKFFNVLEITKKKNDLLIKPGSNLAENFLKSLVIYVKEELPLISNWLVPENPEAYSPENIFNWGNQFLYYMENRRVELFSSKARLRRALPVVLIIKARLQGVSSPRYLYGYHTQSLRYKALARNKPDLKEPDRETIKKIINSKLYLNDLELGRDYKVKRFLRSFAYEGMSRKTGLYTKYLFNLYHAIFKVPTIKLTNVNKWISIEEMEKGETADGIPIMHLCERVRDKKRFMQELKALPLSFKEKQPAHYVDLGPKRRKSASPKIADLVQYLEQDESEELEFKASVRWNYMTNKLDKTLGSCVVKTVAGFLNTSGGTLLIGVGDDKKVLGLKKDIQSLGRKNEDGFIQYIINLVAAGIGLEYCSFINIYFSKAAQKPVCVLQIKPSFQPVFVKQGDLKLFYVRTGNTTRQLNPEETYKYIQMHW